MRKKVKAYFVMHEKEKGLKFWFCDHTNRYVAEIYKHNSIAKSLDTDYRLVPCEITYTLPKKGKRK